MSISDGMFNITRQAQLNSVSVRYGAISRASEPSAGAASTNPLTWSLKKNESAIQAYWRLAPESAAQNAPSLDMVKRLEKAAAGDNKEISAEKLRQAKAKLAALRQQLQLAAASGDPKQIKRLAAEAARLAREIGGAARHLTESAAAGLRGNDEAGTASTTLAGMVEAAGTRDAVLQSVHAIGSDARNALVEAKGIIALAAQMARNRRKESDEDDDGFFRRLQEMVDEALAEVDAGQRAALHAMFPLIDGTGGDIAGSTTILGSVSDTTIEVTATIVEYA